MDACFQWADIINLSVRLWTKVNLQWYKKNTFLTKNCIIFLYFLCPEPCLGTALQGAEVPPPPKQIPGYAYGKFIFCLAGS